jgi:hypothetical protein
VNISKRSTALSRRKLLGLSLGAAGATLAPVPRWLRRALAQDTSGADIDLGTLTNIHIVTEVGSLAFDQNESYWWTVPNIFSGLSLFGHGLSPGEEWRKEQMQREYDRLLIQHYEEIRAYREDLWTNHPEQAIFNSVQAQQVIARGADKGMTTVQMLSLIDSLAAAASLTASGVLFINYGAIPIYEQLLGAMAAGTITLEVVTLGGALAMVATVGAIGILAGIAFFYLIWHYEAPEVVHAIMPTAYGVQSLPQVSVTFVESEPWFPGVAMATHGLQNVAVVSTPESDPRLFYNPFTGQMEIYHDPYQNPYQGASE